MITAPIPHNETDRLKDLHRSQLLDSAHEQEFDEIVKFASQICSMPISLISLVDSNRQWFKARIGLDVDETNRDISFCSHAILQDQLFEIPDALLDERFSDNPLVLDAPSIRFYAGMPLVTESGSRLGTLCVIDSVPRNLTEQQKFGLRVLAESVIKIADLRIKNQQLFSLAENQKKIISILAHDVRSPLTSIKSVIEFRDQGLLEQDEAAEMLSMAAVQLDQTLDMVNNIVNWGQMQLKFSKIVLEDIKIAEVIDLVFASESLKAKMKGNTLINQVDFGLVSLSDRQALEFIFRNLVSNANKFTDSGTITISAEAVSDGVLIILSDTGVGISKDTIAKILASEEYASTLGTGNEKGNGLGLMLVKEFIQHLNGTLSIDSAPGKGTSFKILL